MTAGDDGSPEVAEGKKNPARTLGVRTGGRIRDIDVDRSGTVYPMTGGMSVNPPPPENMAEHRRPPEYGGIGRDPVWVLETEALPPELTYRPDPDEPSGTHGFIEPSASMSLDDYEEALRAPRGMWRPF
jgi:hypothetical protein